MSSSIDPAIIEARKRAIEASYLRQLDLAGKPGYDPQLTVKLKEDLYFGSKSKSLKLIIPKITDQTFSSFRY